MSTIWIIGRKATIATNLHEYMTEPFIVFETNEDAQAACDMIEKVSGERPMIASSVLYRKGVLAEIGHSRMGSRPPGT